MANIPSEFIDQLLDRIDIIDVISPRVTLKKAGKDYQALCPFHTENSPSFTVSQNKQFYHCFGCGKNGSAISFLMEFEGLDFVDCVETLAQSAGMSLPESNQNNRSNYNKNLYAVVEGANRYFLQSLTHFPQAQKYLFDRGISDEVMKTFQVGFAPESWDGLLKRHKNQQSELLQAGLLVENDNGKVYDKFRNRIMFPIQDKRSRIIAFGGRVLTADQKPKYLNSPETPLFHKGKELYGLNIARKHSRADNIIVVEGYMDVIAMHQAGFKNGVATLGTATSNEHIITLLRSYDVIIFCFDGDKAGKEAAWKALKTALPVYRDDKTIKFLFLPDEHDPDTYIKNYGAEAFQKQLDNASSLSNFLLKRLKAQIDLNSIDGRALFIDRSKAFITQLPKGQFRKLLQQEISSISKTSVDFASNKPSPTNVNNIKQWTPVRKVIAILVNRPELVTHIPKSLEFQTLNLNGIKILTEMVDFCRNNPHISSAVLLENFRQHPAYTHLTTLMTVSLDLNDEQLLLELDDINHYFAKLIQKHKIHHLRNKQTTDGLTTTEKKLLVDLLTDNIQ